MKAFTIWILTIIFTAMTISAQTMPPVETGVSQTLAKWRAANYSDVRYKLNLTLEKMSPVLKGTIEVRVNVRESGGETKKVGEFQRPDSLPIIVLDWRKIKGKENLSTISNVSVNGSRVILNPDFSKFNFIVEGREEQNFFEINEHLVFQDGVKIGENIIKLDFTSPIATSGSGVTRYVDKEDNAEYIYSQVSASDAGTAFPVFDQPNLKARFKLRVEYPGDWYVVSNTNASCGRMDPMARPRCHFEETQPISIYVFAFAAGDFAEFKDWSDVGPVKTAPVGSSIIYEPRRNPNAAKIYVRQSQAGKFKSYEKEFLVQNRSGNKFVKLDIVLLPEISGTQTYFEGLKFLRESSVFR